MLPQARRAGVYEQITKMLPVLAKPLHDCTVCTSLRCLQVLSISVPYSIASDC